MKQTAVEFLIEELYKLAALSDFLEKEDFVKARSMIFEKAKLIEIDQMRAVNMLTFMNKDFDFEQYIKEHYE